MEHPLIGNLSDLNLEQLHEKINEPYNSYDFSVCVKLFEKTSIAC